MSNYYLILIWIAFFGILGMFIQMQKAEVVCGKKVYRMQEIWAVILVFPLVLWTAYRDYIGDTWVYIKSFNSMPLEISGIQAYMETIEKDRGFYFVSALIKTIIGERVHLYFFIIAAVQCYLLYRVYRKYSTRYAISFFLFIASTDYVSWMFNGTRQFVAVTITVACFEFILEKKYIKAIIGILIASLFHGSALLVIPFIFITQGKAWNKKTIMFILLALVAVAYIEQFTDILDNLLQETQYENVVTDWETWSDDGTNAFRVLVYSVPTILSLVGLKYIRAEDDSVINICTNMSIVSMGIYVVSMFTSGIFIGRLPIYFSLYNYILLPWGIENIFTKESARIIYILMCIAYLAFYYFQITLSWGYA